MSYTQKTLARMAESDQLSREGEPVAALLALVDDASEDYPWGGSVEPYDASMEAELFT